MHGYGVHFHNEQIRLLNKIDKTKYNEENRTFARSIFSMVEGIAYRLRQILLERYKRNEIILLPEEIIILSEVSLNIDNNGKIKRTNIFFKFENLFRFTIITYCKYYQKEDVYKKYISDHRYSDFKESIKIRNRITHPKSSKDIFVTGKDVIILDSTREWFHKFMIEIFNGDLLKETY